MITNGIWYAGMLLGTIFDLGLLTGICASYIAWLYTPWACEKILILPIALWLCKRLFKKSEKTQLQIQTMIDEAKSDFNKIFRRRQSK